MLKKIIIAASCFALAACGRPMDYNGKTYPTYGLINEESKKSNDMCYETSIGNVVWSILLIETIVAPIYFIGFSIQNPVGPKHDGKCGIDA